MKRHKSDKQKYKPLQPADFPPPKRISQEKALELCEWLGISHRHAAEVKDYLDDLVDYVHKSMSLKTAANRKGDRDRIANIRDQVNGIREQLQDMRIDGRLAVRTTAERLADILSGDWLRNRFPNDAPSKSLREGRRPPEHQPARVSTDADIAYFNYQFIRDRAPETLDALLGDMASAFVSALTSLNSDPRVLGGRQPLTHRHIVILNLANIWRKVGKKPVGTPGSVFAVFCEEIFEAMGWPTSGLDGAIPDAIKSLRNRR